MEHEKSQQNGGLKSALDVAMERCGGVTAAGSKLSEEQKRALSEVERNLQAKIAEIEIMAAQAIARARAARDYEEAEKLEAQKREEITRWRAHAEEDRERIRRGE